MSARLEVDLDAFAANLGRVREVTSPSEVMLVVKDDAYGHGLTPIVQRAAAEGVGWFGAFDADTGTAVRAVAGDAARIFIWIAASPSEAAAAVAADLDIGVGDAELLEDVAHAADAASAVARVHLKIDTGLHRNGVRPEAWPAFVERARELELAGSVQVVGVWSHIAEASDDEDDRARGLYEEALSAAVAVGLSPSFRHLAASAAAFARSDFRYDLVRVGAFCYGIAPAGGPTELELGIRPIGTLRADVVAVEGERVRVAIGSLDGLPSSLAGRVDVGTPGGNRRLLTIGRHESLVEMWPGARTAQSVVVYGPAAAGASTATGLAEAIGTIGEEIALRVSPGVVREYRGS